MRTSPSRRVLLLATLAAPFVLALSFGAANAGATVIRGRGAQRIQIAPSDLHGAALALTVAGVALAVILVTHLVGRGSWRTPTAEPERLPVERDASLEEPRKAA